VLFDFVVGSTTQNPVSYYMNDHSQPLMLPATFDLSPDPFAPEATAASDNHRVHGAATLRASLERR